MSQNSHTRRIFLCRRLAAIARAQRLRKTLANEQGASMVEFALSAIVLLTMSVGLLGVSLAAYSYIFVSGAARDATRYAIVRGASLKTDCNAPGYATCIAQVDDITQYIKQRAFPGIDSSNINVDVNWIGADGISCGTTDDCKVPGNFVHVTVSYPYELNVPLMPSQTINVSGSSEMVIAQ